MNAELCRLAQEKIGNVDILVNLISMRVRQLNSGSRALIDAPMLSAASVALTELVEGKMDYELLDEVAPEILTAKSAKKGKKKRKKK
jgi:DNA-directed RNA polymerase subunit omega